MTREKLDKIAWDFFNSHTKENYEIIELFGIAYDNGYNNAIEKAYNIFQSLLFDMNIDIDFNKDDFRKAMEE